MKNIENVLFSSCLTSCQFFIVKNRKKIILKKTSCLLLLKAIVFVSGEINTHFSMNSPLKSRSDWQENVDCSRGYTKSVQTWVYKSRI